MIVLNQEQINFIDHYLQVSKVRYVDVRSELTDHIASAIEQKMNEDKIDFYEAFKVFMAENKQELLKRNNSSFTYFKESIINFCPSLIHPTALISGCVLFFLIWYFGSLLSLVSIHYVSYCLILFFGLFQKVYFNLVIKKQFLCLDYLNYTLAIICFLSAMLNGLLDGFKGNVFTISLILTLVVVYSRYTYSIMAKFKSINI